MNSAADCSALRLWPLKYRVVQASQKNLQWFPQTENIPLPIVQPPTSTSKTLKTKTLKTVALINSSSLRHCGGGDVPGSKANKAKVSGDIFNSCALTRPSENTEREFSTTQLAHTHSQPAMAITRLTNTMFNPQCRLQNDTPSPRTCC